MSIPDEILKNLHSNAQSFVSAVILSKVCLAHVGPKAS